MNIMFVEAELIAICIGLIPTIDNKDIHNIIVIIDSITIASKILESQINPFQKIIILLVTRIRSFLSKDNRNAKETYYILGVFLFFLCFI